MGANPITWSDTLAYYQLIDYKPSPWELDLITKLDNIVLEIYADKLDKEHKKATK